MNLAHPEARRALRSVVQALVALIVIAIVAYIVHLLDGQPRHLSRIAMGCLSIVFIGTLLYGAENVTRAVNFSLGRDGLRGSIGEGPGDAAQKTADAAQKQADHIQEIEQ